MIHFLRCFPGAMKSEKDTFVNRMNILELNTNANQFQISNKSVFGLLFFWLTLSCDYRWKFCNLSDTCMHHKQKPLGNGKRSGRFLSSTRCMCNTLRQRYALKKKQNKTHTRQLNQLYKGRRDLPGEELFFPLFSNCRLYSKKYCFTNTLLKLLTRAGEELTAKLVLAAVVFFPSLLRERCST